MRDERDEVIGRTVKPNNGLAGSEPSGFVGVASLDPFASPFVSFDGVDCVMSLAGVDSFWGVVVSLDGVEEVVAGVFSLVGVASFVGVWGVVVASLGASLTGVPSLTGVVAAGEDASFFSSCCVPNVNLGVVGEVVAGVASLEERSR